MYRGDILIRGNKIVILLSKSKIYKSLQPFSYILITRKIYLVANLEITTETNLNFLDMGMYEGEGKVLKSLKSGSFIFVTVFGSE